MHKNSGNSTSCKTMILLGFISCWIVDGKSRPSSTFSNSSQHSAAITVLKWNPSGKRVITGDKVKYYQVYFTYSYVLIAI